MDRTALKTKRMRKILEPIEDEVKKLLESLQQDKTKVPDLVSLKSVLFDQMQILINKFDNVDKDIADDYKEIKCKAIEIMNHFCSTTFDKNVEVLDHNICKNMINMLLNNFVTSLKQLENLEYVPIKQALQECIDYLKEMGTIEEIEDYQNIKDLATFILDTFGPLQIYRKSLASPLLSDRIALYSRQLYITFTMLVKLVEEQHRIKAPIINSKKYICNRMCYLFEMIVKTLESPNPSEDEERYEVENHFVFRMDLVLDILSEMMTQTPPEQYKQCDELWLRIEDVFTHAMAIAQVCEVYNFNAITGICQTIINEFQKLKIQLQVKPIDTMIINLFINTLNDALYQLEHRINVSMLTLVMETFSDPFCSLKKLVKTCGNAIDAKRRSSSDLKEATEEFDQMFDKTMQIGLFAMACCRNTDRVNRVRSCLASFESLETELIPSVTAFYLNPSNEEMRSSVKLITEQLQKELNTFHRTIYLIIDAAAYCQVVLDDLQDRITKLSNSLDNFETITYSQIQIVVKRALSLAYQITATIADIGRENIDVKTINLNRELKAAIHEAHHASNMLERENVPEAQQLRVIKRCELILSVIKKLLPNLNIVMNTSVQINASRDKSNIHRDNNFCNSNMSIHQRPVSYIRTPYTVKSCKTVLSLQPANSVGKVDAKLHSLIPYIKEGRTMRTEHSILYVTPRKKERRVNNRSTRNLSNIRQHLFSKDSFYQNDDINLSVESADLTSILNKLTLSNADKFKESIRNSPQNESKSLKMCVNTNDKSSTKVSDKSTHPKKS